MKRKQHRRSILVVGSANMDLVVTCERFPQPGETILAGDFAMHAGGKGANQAVACARLGGDVSFLGKLGRDIYADRLRESLSANKVDSKFLLTDPVASTGVALITVNREGENQIVVVPGSNMKLSPADVEASAESFLTADVVLLQLEIPLETVEAAAALARSLGKRVVLNPAPAGHLPPSLLQHIDVITPNETEAAILTGLPIRDTASAERAARKLMDFGVRNVVVTLGGRGCLLVTPDDTVRYPAARVTAVDTTAAGDAFNGALAVALVDGQDLHDAVRFACAAGTLAVTKAGAQEAMPSRSEVQALLTTLTDDTVQRQPALPQIP
ncbi:MAG TPA: ribokinase [Rhodothermales bacterium]|nr:ribokinase [Rhodothermales bacterium]